MSNNKRKSALKTKVRDILVGFLLGIITGFVMTTLSPTLEYIGDRYVKNYLFKPKPNLNLKIVEDIPDKGIVINVTNDGTRRLFIHNIEVCLNKEIILYNFENQAKPSVIRMNELKQDEILPVTFNFLYNTFSDWFATCSSDKAIYPKIIQGKRDILPGENVELLIENVPNIEVQSILTNNTAGGDLCTFTLYGDSYKASSMLFYKEKKQGSHKGIPGT